MRIDTSDYIDRQEQGRESGADPKKKEDTAIILGARDAAVTDPHLSDGARNLFTFLLDKALNSSTWFRRRGQVAISNTQLRERLHRSARAIYGWTRDLVENGHIWVSRVPRPNTQPMNVFHIQALQPKREGAEIPGDGMWGNGYRQPARAMPLGARGGSGKKRHYLFDQFGNPIFVQLPQNEPAARNICGGFPQNLREPSAKNDTCPPQNLRETTAEFAGAPRKKEHLPPAKNDTVQQQKPAVLTETGDVRSSPLGDLSNVQRGNAFKKGGENGFLQHVAMVYARWDPKWAESEMTGSGPWYRQCYKKDSDKACRVLADINVMIKEGRSFERNPGAAFIDLWKRFQ